MNDKLRLMEEAAQIIEFTPVVSGGCRGPVRTGTLHTCCACGQRRSRFYTHGSVRADRSHTLCFECYRSVVNRTRALRKRVASDIRMLASAPPVPAKLRGDRGTFLADLDRRRHQAQIVARHAVDGLTAMNTLEPLTAASEILERVS